ncbi:AGAP006980-PA-like protein [Anopheles sinensis]|uniref:AGAP006980-PA-like protein n=1 Tax=Anopheles sinensis TaxID=74873 RepID=A0A084WRN5_ANOSI|nr:AGAP006980-PA-like protein [Anopheles sinensis]
MLKVLCMLAVIVVVAVGMPQNSVDWPAPRPIPMGRLVKREIPTPSVPETEQKQVTSNEPTEAVEGQDDMDKAETFGFGYHRYYTYPRYYYPSYYYGYYPRYYYGYYCAMPGENTPVLEGNNDAPQLTPVSEDAPTVSGTTDTPEDMDKAETFGFGYRKIIHVYPHYYPRYYYVTQIGTYGPWAESLVEELVLIVWNAGEGWYDWEFLV